MTGAITKIAFGETSDVKVSRFRAPARLKTSQEIVARQSKVAVLAFQKLGDRRAALDFLHSADAELGGRPIDVASESDAGAERVLAALRTHDVTPR